MRGLRNVTLAGALAAALAAPAFAAGPKAAPAPGHLDYVFLASDRPVRIRLHLEAGGRPYHAPWDDYVRKFFAWFDRNRDGVLDRKEAANVPNFNFLNKVTEIEEVKSDFPLPISPMKWPEFWHHGKWNELRARIEGNPPKITTWIKGVKFMEYQDTEKRLSDRGGIALQVHGGGDFTKQFVRYRNIRVKELKK